jgi:hypothetical protein
MVDPGEAVFAGTENRQVMEVDDDGLECTAAPFPHLARGTLDEADEADETEEREKAVEPGGVEVIGDLAEVRDKGDQLGDDGALLVPVAFLPCGLDANKHPQYQDLGASDLTAREKLFLCDELSGTHRALELPLNNRHQPCVAAACARFNLKEPTVRHWQRSYQGTS